MGRGKSSDLLLGRRGRPSVATNARGLIHPNVVGFKRLEKITELNREEIRESETVSQFEYQKITPDEARSVLVRLLFTQEQEAVVWIRQRVEGSDSVEGIYNRSDNLKYSLGVVKGVHAKLRSNGFSMRRGCDETFQKEVSASHLVSKMMNIKSQRRIARS